MSHWGTSEEFWSKIIKRTIFTLGILTDMFEYLRLSRAMKSNEPAQDKTYNKKCNQQRLRSACISNQHGKSSLLSIFG